MAITESFILAQAPNAAAAENGRKLSKKGSFSGHHKTADGTLYWADCAGSGKTPYHTSVDFVNPGTPICRCSCPSRQFPCKHALGLLFEILADKPFAVAELPQDIADKRAKQAARAAKKEEAGEAGTTAQPKKPNAAAQSKKIKKQLEGLDMAQRMIDDLLAAGLSTLAGTSIQSYEKLAKDLGSYYLTGPQLAFSRLALTVKAIQRDPANAARGYAEASRILVPLASTTTKARALVEARFQQGQFTAEDTILYEALGGIWRLEDLRAIGSYKENAQLVQLSFDVCYDEARREFVDRGYWIDADTGEIGQTLHYRPVKALKYVKAEDSCFDLVCVPELFRYPGELNRRIRWEGCTMQPLTPDILRLLRTKAQPDLATAVKLVKNQIKNTLSPKFAGVLLPYSRLCRIGGETVLEDPAGARIVLRDREEDGDDHRTVARLAMLPEAGMLENQLLFGLMFYDEADRRICVHPYSLLTGEQIVRLQY